MASVQELLLAAQAQRKPNSLVEMVKSLVGGAERGVPLAHQLAQLRQMREERENQKRIAQDIKDTTKRLEKQKEKKKVSAEISVIPGKGVTRTYKTIEAEGAYPIELQTGLANAINLKDVKQQRRAFATLSSRYPKHVNEIAKVGNMVLPSKPQSIALTKGLPAESAGKLASIQTSIQDLDKAKKLIVKTKKKDGKETKYVDRNLLFTTIGSGVPFSEGRDFNSFVENALATKLRLETGATATQEELENIAKRFKPQLGDSDKTIISKMDRLEDFMDQAEFIIDPRGEFGMFGVRDKQDTGDLESLSDEELLSIIRGGENADR